jgi:hypothetical protein
MAGTLNDLSGDAAAGQRLRQVRALVLNGDEGPAAANDQYRHAVHLDGHPVVR